MIIEGRGCAEGAGAAPLEVGAGDFIVVPPGASQRIRNVGASDLVFLAVCTPRFTREAYEDIDPDPM
ncbi:MAG TPA: cupin domain-containing protein [Thioalkalivibrio sp.]|nr:cupin domain-containing protein [Thioalkalivibrio sp.]